MDDAGLRLGYVALSLFNIAVVQRSPFVSIWTIYRVTWTIAIYFVYILCLDTDRVKHKATIGYKRSIGYAIL